MPPIRGNARHWPKIKSVERASRASQRGVLQSGSHCQFGAMHGRRGLPHLHPSDMRLPEKNRQLNDHVTLSPNHDSNAHLHRAFYRITFAWCAIVIQQGSFGGIQRSRAKEPWTAVPKSDRLAPTSPILNSKTIPLDFLRRESRSLEVQSEVQRPPPTHCGRLRRNWPCARQSGLGQIF
jgi:hypothetical protein